LGSCRAVAELMEALAQKLLLLRNYLDGLPQHSGSINGFMLCQPHTALMEIWDVVLKMRGVQYRNAK